jgi:hypothetical protein
MPQQQKYRIDVQWGHIEFIIKLIQILGLNNLHNFHHLRLLEFYEVYLLLVWFDTSILVILTLLATVY